MRHALWPAASLALLSAAAPAAQGVHPGPLPTPITSESDGRQAPPGAGRTGLDAYRSGPGYSAAPTAEDYGGYGYDDPGYPPPPPPGGGRGYWQWVPAEPSGSGPYGSGPSAAPYRGHGDSYAPYGYGTPPDAFGDSYRGRTPQPSYGGYGGAYPGYGSGNPYAPDAYAPGYYESPPAPGGDTGSGGYPAAPSGALPGSTRGKP
jgi:hypothetical protein